MVSYCVLLLGAPLMGAIPCPLRWAAKCSKRSNLAYDDFLRASIHHGVNGREHAGVSLSFRYAADGEEHLFDVCRTWKVSDDRLREDLRVFRDGALDQWLSENWP